MSSLLLMLPFLNYYDKLIYSKYVYCKELILRLFKHKDFSLLFLMLKVRIDNVHQLHN